MLSINLGFNKVVEYSQSHAEPYQTTGAQENMYKHNKDCFKFTGECINIYLSGHFIPLQIVYL